MTAARRFAAIAMVFAGVTLALLLYAPPRLAVLPLVLAVLFNAIGLELLRADSANRENRP